MRQRQACVDVRNVSTASSKKVAKKPARRKIKIMEHTRRMDMYKESTKRMVVVKLRV